MRLTRKLLADRKGLAAAVIAVVALGSTAGITLGGFSATIENPTNTFSSGTIQLEEGVATTTCFSTGTGSGGSVASANTGTCSSEDDLGATLDQMPGIPTSTTVTLTNVGNDPTTSSELVAGACSQAAATDDSSYVGADTDFCGKVDLSIEDSTSGDCVYPVAASAPCGDVVTGGGTLDGFESANYTTLSPLAAGASASYVITVELDPTNATNADQGLTATIPLTWSITQ
jgi:hypothetical protein